LQALHGTSATDVAKAHAKRLPPGGFVQTAFAEVTNGHDAPTGRFPEGDFAGVRAPVCAFCAK
jgi:hypothetical protein